MTPFIVTTKRRCTNCLGIEDEPFDDPPCPKCEGAATSETRRALATLEGREVWNALYGVEVPSREDVVDAIAALPDSGGTVGPLPDGTVIEVEPATWRALVSSAAQADKLSPAVALELAKRAENDTEMAQGQIVAAYNAAQAEGLMT